MFTKLLRLFRAPKSTRTARRPSFRPQFEGLETREVPASLISHNLLNTDTGNNDSGDTNFFSTVVVSDNGRYVLFHSQARDLVSLPVDVNENLYRNLYRHDRLTNTTELVNVNFDGTAGSKDGADNPSMSADGRFITFESNGRDLVAGYTGPYGVYVRDMQTGTTRLVSSDSSGRPADGASNAPVISPDGRYVAFISRDNPNSINDFTGVPVPVGGIQLYVKDTQTGVTSLVTVNTGGSGGANTNTVFLGQYAFSADGTKLVFTSGSNDLVAKDTNNAADVFIRDLVTGTTTLVSVNGVFIAQAVGCIWQLPGAPVLSASANGASKLLGISRDGTRVLFHSFASDLVLGRPQDAMGNVFVRDLRTGTTTMVSLNQAGTDSEGITGAISGDGRCVVFESSEALVPGAPAGGGVYWRNLETGELRLVNVRPDGMPSSEPAVLTTSRVAKPEPRQALSHDGRYVVFVSAADDLVSGFMDGNPAGAATEVFIRDMVTGITSLMSDSQTSPTMSGNDQSEFPSISPDGTVVVFHSRATDLNATDTNNALDVFANLVPPPPPAPVATTNHPIGVALSARGQGLRKKLWARVTRADGTSFDVRSPFHRATFANIAAALHDLDGDGSFDSIRFTARRGTRSVSRIVPL